MRIVEDLSLINEDVMDISLLTDETNTVEDPKDLEFSWYVTEFEARYMKI